MSLLSQYLREPASALTHGLWFMAGLVLFALIISGTKETTKRVSLAVYGLTLLFCSGASTLFHAIHADHATIEWYNRLDHIGIGLLIAGTYTPIAVHLLHKRTGVAILTVIWLSALASAVLRLTVDPIPKMLATSIYLVMGWGALPGYWMLCRRLSVAKTRMIAEGGLLYSVGALIHGMNAPDLVPGVFDAHALFHVFVMLGSLRHFQFISSTVLPSFDMESLGTTEIWAVTPPLASRPEPPRPIVRKPYFWNMKQISSARFRQNESAPTRNFFQNREDSLYNKD